MKSILPLGVLEGVQSKHLLVTAEAHTAICSAGEVRNPSRDRCPCRCSTDSNWFVGSLFPNEGTV